MEKTKGSILVIRGGAIGDFILTLPVLAALRSQFPSSSIEVLGYTHIIRLARAGGLVDKAHCIESAAFAAFFADNARLDPKMADFLGSFNIIVSYLHDPYGFFKENLERAGVTHFIAGSHRPQDDGDQHATQVLLTALEQLAIWDTNPVPTLKIPPGLGNGKSVTLDASKKWLAAHPGSGSQKKNWAWKNWKTLLQQLCEETDYNLLVVAGEAEGENVKTIGDFLPEDRYVLMKSYPLDIVGSVLSVCQGFVGHDSGITHLAAAVGLPCIALWGPTNPKVWSPKGDHARILQADSLESLEVSKVAESVQAMMEKPEAR